MKYVNIILLGAVICLTGCKKHELKDSEYYRCEQGCYDRYYGSAFGDDQTYRNKKICLKMCKAEYNERQAEKLRQISSKSK